MTLPFAQCLLFVLFVLYLNANLALQMDQAFQSQAKLHAKAKT